MQFRCSQDEAPLKRFLASEQAMNGKPSCRLRTLNHSKRGAEIAADYPYPFFIFISIAPPIRTQFVALLQLNLECIR